MTWKKRIISIVLCLCALLCAASVRADVRRSIATPSAALLTRTLATITGTCDDVNWTAWNGTTTINKDFFGSLTEKYLYPRRMSHRVFALQFPKPRPSTSA